VTRPAHPHTAPVGKAAQKEAAKTQDEFDGLMGSRQTPAKPAATGQNLTRELPCPWLQFGANRGADYHSFFYDLLSVREHEKQTENKLTHASGSTRACPRSPTRLP
jgi:hypothetical protein